jgi:hypothetical protein
MLWTNTYIGTFEYMPGETLRIPYHYKRTYSKWISWTRLLHRSYHDRSYRDTAFVPVTDGMLDLSLLWTDLHGTHVPEEVLCYLISLCQKTGIDITPDGK